MCLAVNIPRSITRVLLSMCSVNYVVCLSIVNLFMYPYPRRQNVDNGGRCRYSYFPVHRLKTINFRRYELG